MQRRVSTKYLLSGIGWSNRKWSSSPMIAPCSTESNALNTLGTSLSCKIPFFTHVCRNDISELMTSAIHCTKGIKSQALLAFVHTTHLRIEDHQLASFLTAVE